MKTRTTGLPGRWKCRNAGCNNHYDDVIGGDNAFGKHKAGAECIPCLYAAQMVDHGQTIEQVEAVPQLMEMFTQLLGNTGWTWEHVKEAHARMYSARIQ
jgi:hypothetical protein